MTDLPREKLGELIATYGQTLCDDPRRCEALLRDLCAANRREIHALVSALRERVAADLLATSEGVPREVLRARLTQRLQDNLGLAEEIARWAVDSWALALGKLSWAELGAVAGSSSTASSPALPAPSRRRPLVLAGLGVGVGLVVVLATALFKLSSKPPYPGDQDRARAMERLQSETQGQQTMVIQKPQEPERSAPGVAMWRPYPFGQVDPIRYLKSLVIANLGNVSQIGPHVYCLEECLYSVEERAGTVSAIGLPLGMARDKIALEQSLVWLKLTESRGGEEYLVGSSSTLNELVARLADTWQELATSPRDQLTLTLNRLTFVLNRKDGVLLVILNTMARPYPFGQADPVRYLKSLIIADSDDVREKSPHNYCRGKQKEAYCVSELGGTVATIILRMVEDKTALAQSLVWLKLTESRGGEEYLVGSSSTLNELVGRLADTWQKLKTSRHTKRMAIFDGQLCFVLFRDSLDSLLVFDPEYLNTSMKKDGERHQSSSTPGSP